MQAAFIIVLFILAGFTYFLGAGSKVSLEGTIYYLMSIIFITGALIIGAIAESNKKTIIFAN